MKVLAYLRWQWDRTLATGLLIVGLVALFKGFHGARHTGLVAEQIPYIISGGMFGLFLLGVAGVLWLSADLRDEWGKLDDLDKTLTRIEERLPVAEDLPPQAPSVPANHAMPSRARR